MRIIDVINEKTSIPCEVCMYLSTYKIVFNNAGVKYDLYLCSEHFGDKEGRLEAIQKIKNRERSGDFNILNAEYKNVKFKAYFDQEFNVLHVLDNMGKENYMSVTNGIEKVYPYLEKYFKLKNREFSIFIYGTDGIISKYNKKYGNYKYIEQKDPFVFSIFLKEMKNIYKFY